MKFRSNKSLFFFFKVTLVITIGYILLIPNQGDYISKITKIYQNDEGQVEPKRKLNELPFDDTEEPIQPPVEDLEVHPNEDVTEGQNSQVPPDATAGSEEDSDVADDDNGNERENGDIEGVDPYQNLGELADPDDDGPEEEEAEKETAHEEETVDEDIDRVPSVATSEQQPINDNATNDNSQDNSSNNINVDDVQQEPTIEEEIKTPSLHGGRHLFVNNHLGAGRPAVKPNSNTTSTFEEEEEEQEEPEIQREPERYFDQTFENADTLESMLSAISMEIPNTEGTRFISLSFVNQAQMSLTLNWLCYAENVDFENHIFLSVDHASSIWLEEYGSPVFQIEPKLQKIFPDGFKESDLVMYPGSVEFLKFVLIRTGAILEILKSGYSVLLSDIDAIWISDPKEDLIPLIVNGKQLIAQQETDSKDTSKTTQLGGGFIFLKSTEQIIKLWEHIYSKMEENILDITSGKKPGDLTLTETNILNKLFESSDDLTKGINVEKLSKELYPSGVDIFGKTLTDNKNTYEKVGSELQQYVNGDPWPVIIHNNYARTLPLKLSRFKQYDMWKVANLEEKKCVDLTVESPLFLMEYTLEIKIMVTSKTVKNLKDLLQSLQSADYSQKTKATKSINLDVYIIGDSETLSSTSEIVNFVNSFQWKYGSLNLHHEPDNLNNFIILSSWTNPKDNEYAIFVDESVKFAKNWFKSVDKVIQSSDKDPQVFGMSLLGFQGCVSLPLNDTQCEKRLRESIDINPVSTISTPNDDSSAINDQSIKTAQDYSIFMYQLVDPYAQLVFPSHWKKFQKTIIKDYERIPLARKKLMFSNLETNAECTLLPTDKLGKNLKEHLLDRIPWYCYFIAYTGLSGTYSIYPNGFALASRTQDVPESKDLWPKYYSNQVDSVGAFDSVDDADLMDGSGVPILDFHLKYVGNRHYLKNRSFGVHGLNPT